MATTRIVDINGNPFPLELDAPQTEADAKLAQLYHHFGGHPSRGLTPTKLAAIMSEAEQGDLIRQCELAEDMEEKDGHIQSELGKRRLAIQGVEWNIVPPPNPSTEETRDAEQIEELLRSATWLDDAVFDASDAILKSFACLELAWDFAEGLHYVDGATWRDSSWFQTHPDKRNELRLRDGSYEGAPLRPFGWIQHQARAKSGYLSRRGLVRVLAWPFLFKSYSVRDLAEFLEIYGLPVRLGKYPEGATEREKMTLLRAVLGIGHNAGGIIPRGMEIEFENAADGGADPFMAMVAWCEKTQSKAILGGTLTSQADGASSTNALGNVHNEVRKELRNADLKQLENTLTRDLVYPLYALNGKSYRSPRRIPRLVFDISEPEDMKEIVPPLQGLVSMGVQVPISWVRDKLQIPVPQKGEAVLSLPVDQASQGDGQAALKASRNHWAVLAVERQAEDKADRLANRLSAAGEDVLAGWADEMEALLSEVDSLEEFRDRLLERYQDLPTDELATLMQRAMVAAELAGMTDVGTP